MHSMQFISSENAWLHGTHLEFVMLISLMRVETTTPFIHWHCITEPRTLGH